MHRPRENDVWFGAFDDFARVHHSDFVGPLRDNAEIVSNQKHGHAEAIFELTDQIENLRLNGDVERSRWLVGHQQARIAAQRHGNHHPLPHPP